MPTPKPAPAQAPQPPHHAADAFDAFKAFESLDALSALSALDVLDDIQFPDVDFKVPDLDFKMPDIDLKMPHLDIQVPDMPFVYIPDPQAIEDAQRMAKDAMARVHIDRDQIERATATARDAARDAREHANRSRDAIRESARSLSRLDRLPADLMAAMPRPFLYGPDNAGQLARMFERCDTARRDKDDDSEDRFYDCGRRALDESQYDRAVDYFTRAVAVKGTRADGALYWKAYAQDRLGQRTEALATLAELKTGYAKSRWASDANSLEVEVRRRAGQKIEPANAVDDEMKLLALQGLGDSPDSVPMLEQLLHGPQSPKLKERALFVLAQNQNPAARAVVYKVAKGGANPELQVKAIRYCGQFRTAESREVLSQVYASAPDVAVRKMILRSYMEAQDRERLVAAARAEQDASLRVEAVRQLGNLQAFQELSDLYGKEAVVDVKKQILRAMANSGNIDRFVILVKNEQDVELKRMAIRTMSGARSENITATLVGFYEGAQPEVKEAVVNTLFEQGNATALISLARKERDVEMRKRLVSRLSQMARDNKEAKDYMLELLK
jgi:tetratricopeptide (TPR) repeat protein